MIPQSPPERKEHWEMKELVVSSLAVVPDYTSAGYYQEATVLQEGHVPQQSEDVKRHECVVLSIPVYLHKGRTRSFDPSANRPEVC